MAYGDKVIDHYENPRNVGNFGTTSEVKERRTSASAWSARPSAATSCSSRSRSTRRA
jgi:NifU-like protein involved in Fe-S cluster formation